MIVDEEAAIVVKRIFDLCLEGYGPTQIARILQTDKVLAPSVYWQTRDIPCPAKAPDNPYKWVSDTVADILEKRDYLGHTVNFKTYKQSFKSKKKLYNPEEKQRVFEDTHEAIVDVDTWVRVQDVAEAQTQTGEDRKDYYVFGYSSL